MIELRSRFRMISPVITYNNDEIAQLTPRIHYEGLLPINHHHSSFIIHQSLVLNLLLSTAGNLRMRAIDLTWYGVLMGLGTGDLRTFIPCFLASLFGFVAIVFVVPFLGKRFRPFPISAALLVGVVMINNTMMVPLSKRMVMLLNVQ